jgi:hypothetical protein
VANLIAFYRGTAHDSESRSLHDLWAWDDDRLEDVHDFIQWLFPLPEPSQFNPDAPLLTRDDIAAFKDDAILQGNLRKSFQRILSFLGLSETKAGEIVDGVNFASRAPEVWSAPNHNWLRISRILRCLTLLGLQDEAQALYGWLETAYQKKRFPIDANTFGYWRRAVRG